MKDQISISGYASISSLGSNSADIWKAYSDNNHRLLKKDFQKFQNLVASIELESECELQQLRNSDIKYKTLDRSVLLAIYSSRKAISKVSWDKEFGINIGSSRGATELFEKYHESFLENETGKTATLTSPTTTLGNIATWVAHDLQAEGPAISHSITCSTAMHSLINGVAWIRSGMASKFLVGGSEAANTAFTVAQMKALKIYSRDSENEYPCKALDLDKNANSMVLGEGAVSICLEKGLSENSKAIVQGVGFATEKLKHNISISAEAVCFQKSMKRALQDAELKTVDVVVMHSPGTIKGDLSEYKAIKKVFEYSQPALTTNKWKIGHTLGASGFLSIELALLMLEYQKFIPVPYVAQQKLPRKIETVMINAVGFGGNAVSIILSKP